jgi:predicted RNase H-like nuclease
MIGAGIDGSAGGWVAVVRTPHQFKVYHFSRISQIFELPIAIDLALIDIPLGLGSSRVIRGVEKLARKELSPARHSSVFNVPVRESMQQNNYQLASQTNWEITGKKISRQSWNIVPKIKDADHALQENPGLKKRLLEAHPELCFKYLNHAKIPVFRKRDPGQKGLDERISILRNYYQDVEHFYRQQLKDLHPSIAQPHDLVDALCLCITASLGGQYRLSRLQKTFTQDDFGIEMNMHYFDPNCMVIDSIL